MRAIISGIVAGALIGGSLVGRTAHAQAPAAADLERAKTLYAAAERAVAERRFDDAIRDYGYAYAITKDPVLFYKIASAHEQAGRCDAALTYYRRYLDEGKPAPEFVARTRERIAACGGNPDEPPAPDATAAGAAGATTPAPPPTETGAAAPAGDTTTVGPLGGAPAPAGATPVEAARPPTTLRARHQGPWLLVGGSLALITVGAVLAYSAEATENDLADLYVGLEGQPPRFDDRTRQRYDDVLAEGDRYELLSRVSFGLAGALAIGAGVWFYLDRDTPAEQRTVRVTPHATRDGGGVTTTLRF